MRFSVVPALLILAPAGLFGQLRDRIATIAAEAHGKVAVSCQPVNCDLNPHAHPPMQSVFKLPLALTALHLVEDGQLKLDQPIRFRAGDHILPHTWSPLQDQYPAAEVDVPLSRLLSLAVSQSDNAAADVALRTVGGPQTVDKYIAGLGVRGFHLRDGEAALHRDVGLQYRNWFEPAGAVQLLRRLTDNSPLTTEHTALLLDWMKASTRAPNRIRGMLPKDIVVMDKPGTSGTDDGLTHATNDIGLIQLPDGHYLAIAIFITDSTADEATRDSVIAKITRAAYDSAVTPR